MFLFIKNTHIWVIAFGLFLLNAPLWAGVKKDLSLATSYNNNVLRDSNSQGDYITQLNGSVVWHKRSAQTKTQFYYSGTGYMFAEIGSRSFVLNGAGVSYTRQFAQGKRFHVGSFASVRLDRAAYHIYDHLGWKTDVAYRMPLPGRVMLNAGYTVQTRKYWRMETPYYADHMVFVQASKRFATQTHLRGEMGYGVMHHTGSEGQMMVGLEVGQLLAQNTHLSVRYERKINTHVNLFDDGILDQDIDMLNSRYDYHGQIWSAKLVQQLAHRRILTLTGGLGVRNYQTLTTLAWRGEPLFADELRKDKNPYFSVAFETPLSNRLRARLVYDFESNQSNDTFYNFKKRNNLSVDVNLSF